MSFPGGIGQGLNPVGLLGRILARASNASFGDEFPPLGEEAFPEWSEPRLRDAAKGGDGLVPILQFSRSSDWSRAAVAISSSPRAREDRPQISSKSPSRASNRPFSR